MPSIKKNYLYNLTYQVVAILVPLVTTPYVSRVLGAESVGVYSFTNSIVTYFALFAAFGTALYGQRQIAYVREDKTQRSQVFFEVLLFRVIFTSVCTIVYFGFLIIFTPQNMMVYCMQGILLIAVAFDISWFFMGLEQFKRTVLRNVAVKLVGMVLIFILVKSPRDMALYAGILAGSQLVGNISLFPYLRGLISFSGIGKINPFRDTKTIATLFFPTIAVSIYTVLDKTMIGVFTESAVQNGYYEQSEKIVKTALTLVTSLGVVCIPRIAAAHAAKDIDTIKRIIFRSYRFVWLLALPLIGGIIALASQFSGWFYGPGWDEIPVLISVFSFLLIGIGINNVTGVQYLIPVGLQNVFTATVIAGAVINVVLNLLLIPHMAALGAALASVVAEIAIAVIQLIYVRKTFPVKDVVAPMPKYLAGAVLMTALLWWARGFFSSTILATGVLFVAGSAVYAVSLLILRDSFFLEICKQMLRKARRHT